MAEQTATTASNRETPSAKVWWSNGTFFLGVHIAAALGVWHNPPARTTSQTLWLAVFLWQAASMG